MSFNMTVNFDDLKAVADLLLEIDEAKKNPAKVAVLVLQSQNAVIKALGKHADLIYAPDDEAEAA